MYSDEAEMRGFHRPYQDNTSTGSSFSDLTDSDDDSATKNISQYGITDEPTPKVEEQKGGWRGKKKKIPVTLEPEEEIIGGTWMGKKVISRPKTKEEIKREEEEAAARAVVAAIEEEKEAERQAKCKEFVDLGIECMDRGDDEQAVNYFTQGLEIDNMHPLLLVNRAGAYARMKNFYDAIEDAETIAERRPDWPEGFLMKGTICMDQWKNRYAYCAFDRGLRLDPDNEKLGRGFFEAKLRMQLPKDECYKPHRHSPLEDKFVHDLLRMDPITRDFMADPEFVQNLNLIRRNEAVLKEMLQSDDKRFMVSCAIAMKCDVNAIECDYSPNGPEAAEHQRDLARYNYPYVAKYEPVREFVLPKPKPPKPDKPSPAEPDLSFLTSERKFSMADLKIMKLHYCNSGGVGSLPSEIKRAREESRELPGSKFSPRPTLTPTADVEERQDKGTKTKTKTRTTL